MTTPDLSVIILLSAFNLELSQDPFDSSVILINVELQIIIFCRCDAHESTFTGEFSAAIPLSFTVSRTCRFDWESSDNVEECDILFGSKSMSLLSLLVELFSDEKLIFLPKFIGGRSLRRGIDKLSSLSLSSE